MLVLCEMSAYLHWLKSRMLSMPPSKDGKSLLLNLCARSRFLIPTIVLTAFWLFDAQMHIETSISHQSPVTCASHSGPTKWDHEMEDDDDDNETYSIESYTTNSYSQSSSVMALEEIESAIGTQDFEAVEYSDVRHKHF